MSNDQTSIQCPDDDLLRRFSNINDGSLADDEFGRINEHLTHCEKCSRRLEQIQREYQDFGTHIYDSGDIQTEGNLSFNEIIERLTHNTPVAFGTYELQQLLDVGGMGGVVKAKHSELESNVAVKFSKSVKWTSYFKDEIKAIGKLKDDNIVIATDAGEYKGMTFLVMEFLQGANLKDYVKNGYSTKPSVSESATVSKQKSKTIYDKIVLSCGIIQQSASGLRCAHNAGIIHRDIKPANIWMTEHGTVKVLDLGLAQDVSEESLNVIGGGTPDYMSPEQTQPGVPLDVRTDIYSLGCVFYYLLTGEKPYPDNQFQATSAEELRLLKERAQREQAFPSVQSAGVRIPRRLQAIIDKMTAKNRDERYQSMQEVIDAIEEFQKAYTRPVYLRSSFFAFFAVVFMGLIYGEYTWFNYAHIEKEKRAQEAAQQIHCEYFADYVERWGVPKGIFPLTKEQVAKRQFHYRIETQNGKVIRLVHANSAGTPVPHNSKLLWNSEHQDRPMIMDYYYDTTTSNPSTGKPYLSKSIKKNRYNTEEIIYTYRFNTKLNNEYSVDLLVPKNAMLSRFFKTDAPFSDSNGEIFAESNISTIEYILDVHGHIIRELYMKNNQHEYTNDREGIAGREYERYNDGRIKSIKYLLNDMCDEKEKTVKYKYGNRVVFSEEKDGYENNEAQRQYEYNAATGDFEWITYFGLQDNSNDTKGKFTPCICIHCISVNSGIVVQQLTGDRKTILPKSNIIEYDFDDHGNPVEVRTFNCEHQPSSLNNDSVTKEILRFNCRGDISGTRYYTYNVETKKYVPCECSDGYAIYTSLCNDFGDQTESNYFDQNGKRCFRKEGNARTLTEYDKQGKLMQQEYFGLDGKTRCNLTAGHAGVTYTYDPATDYPIEYRYWNKDGNICMSERDGCAYVVVNYEKGRMKSLEFQDVGRKLCDSNNGYAKVSREKINNGWEITSVDSKMRPLFQYYLNEDGMRCYNDDLNDDLPSYWKKTYDYEEDTGDYNITYSDLEKIESDKFIYSQICYWYNAKDENIQIDYLDANDNLVSGPNEYARIITKYGNDGEITSVSYYDKDENPFDVLMLEDEDIDDKRYWQKQINKIENGYIQTEYNATEKTSLMQDDVSHRVVIADKDGREVCVKFYDKDNKPCEKCDAMVQTEYENLEQYGSGIASVESRFDWNNNLVERSFYNKDEDLCRDNQGVAKYTWKYDKSNRTILFQYYDEKAVVCENNEGICSIEWEYDKNISPNGAVICPVLCKKCNIQGRVLEERYYDKKGQPWRYRGISGFRNEFLQDSNNVKIKQILIDAQGEPTSDVDGVAWILQTYDSDGEMISQQPYNIDGNPCSFQNFPSLPSLIFDEKGKPMGTE